MGISCIFGHNWQRDGIYNFIDREGVTGFEVDRYRGLLYKCSRCFSSKIVKIGEYQEKEGDKFDN